MSRIQPPRFVLRALPAGTITLAAWLAPGAHADTALHRLDGWPYAGAQAIEVDAARELAFLSSGGAILVLDVTHPAAPALRHDGMHTEGHVRDMRYDAASQRLYVADYSGGLEIWDVADPDQPERLGAVPVYYIGTTSDQPTDRVVVSGDYLYINANEARVHAFDVSDPAHPIDLNEQAGPLWYPPYYERDTEDVAMSDSFVYVAGDGIAKYAVAGDGTLTKVGEYLSTEGLSCIEVDGGYAYAGRAGALTVFNVLGYPEMVGSMAISGGLTDLVVDGARLYGVNASSLRIFDRSTPSAPELIGTLSLPRGYRVRVVDDVAYIAADGYGLQVVDVSDPTAPALMATYDTTGSAWDIAVTGTRAFVGGQSDGLVITDVSNPDQVSVISAAGEHVGGESVVVGNHAYVTDWRTPALRVLDLTDISNPIEVGALEGFYAVDLATDGDRLYATTFAASTQLYSLHVLDLTDPAAPVQLGAMEVSEHILEIAYGHGHIYGIQFYDTGLHTIDVTDPTNPHEVDYHPVDWGEDVWVLGDRAYVASFHDGLVVLDLTDPAHPVEMGRVPEPFQFDAVAVTETAMGTLAFTTTGLSTRVLRVYDVSDPSSIAELDRIDLPGEAWDLAARGSYAYVADGYCGLSIVRFGGAPGDVDGDGIVDIADLLAVLSAWGPCTDPPCAEDVDGDGDVDVSDLLTVLANWT